MVNGIISLSWNARGCRFAIIVNGVLQNEYDPLVERPDIPPNTTYSSNTQIGDLMKVGPNRVSILIEPSARYPLVAEGEECGVEFTYEPRLKGVGSASRDVFRIDFSSEFQPNFFSVSEAAIFKDKVPLIKAGNNALGYAYRIDFEANISKEFNLLPLPWETAKPFGSLKKDGPNVKRFVERFYTDMKANPTPDTVIQYNRTRWSHQYEGRAIGSFEDLLIAANIRGLYKGIQSQDVHLNKNYELRLQEDPRLIQVFPYCVSVKVSDGTEWNWGFSVAQDGNGKLFISH